MLFFNHFFFVALFACPIIYWLIPKPEHRKLYLLLGSSVALFYIQPFFTAVLLMAVGFVFLICQKLKSSRSLPILFTTIAGLVIFLLAGKYGKSFFPNLNHDGSDLIASPLIFLGISYLTFKLIAFVIDVYRGVIKEFKFLDLVLFIFFIPIYPAGPIERYQNFVKLHADKFDFNMCIAGLKRIVLGYFKKIVIVNFILNEIVTNNLAQRIFSDGVVLDSSGIYVVAFLVGALLYAYFDLSAYADLAIGFSSLYGYKICENMNYPIIRSNLSNYWNNWHMSLSQWCRNNVYFPVLGKTRNNVYAIYSSFIVMGLWHSISVNWVIWGIWHASGILIYGKWSRSRKRGILKGLPKLNKAFGTALGILITQLYSALGFAFISTKYPSQAFGLLKEIFF